MPVVRQKSLADLIYIKIPMGNQIISETLNGKERGKLRQTWTNIHINNIDIWIYIEYNIYKHMNNYSYIVYTTDKNKIK